MTNKRSPITGQNVSKAKLERTKEMRSNMTPAENRLWQRLRANRLEGFHFRRQQVIEPYIVDFYCHKAGLVAEVDGAIHKQQVEYDHQREEYLKAQGLRVIRFSNQEVNQNLNTVLEEILRFCKPGAE